MAAIKVLIVEDSEVVADVLKETLESDRRVRVVGVASNGQEAIELMPQLSPDLVTMDVWMPVMDGFETVEWIMANKPTPILVITSSKLKEDVQISLRMLAAGALDVIEKPIFTDEKHWQTQQTELISRVRLLSSVRVITHVRGKISNPFEAKSSVKAPPLPPLKLPESPKPPPVLREQPPVVKPISKPAVIAPPTTQVPASTSQDRHYFFPSKPHFQAIAIASSTGGPTALMRILQKLPSNLPSPILIVQHISEGFTQGLVDWLQREVKLKLKIARDYDIPQPGEVLIAPDRRNMLVQPNLKILTSSEGNNAILCPNADSLMYSMADVYRSRAIGVVLTGMGSDGAKGLKNMYERGAYTIAQDEASSLIYGMPRAAAEIGGAREVLALDAIPSRIIELLQLSEDPKYSYREKE